MNPSTNTNQELYKSSGINANINPYTLQPYSTQPSGVPVDITAKSMQKVAPITLPQTANNSPADTIISDINLETQAQINKAAAEQKALELAVGNKAQTEQNAVTKAVESIFGKKADVLANQPAIEEQAGIKAQREAQQLYTGQLAQLNNDYRAEVDRIKKQGGSEEQMRISLGTAYNNYAPKIIDINTLNNAAIANIKGIQEDADRKTALLTAPLDNQLTYYRDFAQKNVDNLTAKENKQLEAIQANLTKQKEDIKAIETAKAQMIAEVAKNGGGSDLLTIKAIQDAQTLSDIASAGKKYIGSLDFQKANAELRKLNAEIGKIKSESGIPTVPNVTNPNAAQYAGLLQTVIASGLFTKDQKASIVSAVNNGENPFTVIKNQAKNIMGQTLATDLDKAETAKAQLEAIDSSLKEYYANGGDTGVFKGNIEKTLNKLGEVKDPKLVGLATQIALAMQSYRLAVTGTAASVQEDARIDNVFPGITNGQVLNNARTQATIKSFDSKIDASYRNTLGSAYDAVKQAQNTTKANTVVDSNTVNGINTAINNGYTPTQIVEKLTTNAKLSPIISQAKAYGYTDQEIINYLQKK